MPDPVDERLWRFDETADLLGIEERLHRAGLNYSRHSTTVSYFLSLRDGNPWLDSYELHAVYTGSYLPNGDPEVEKSHMRNSYAILERPEGTHWIAESAGEKISEADFYGKVIYSSPDRMLSLQQISFETATASFLVELNMESKLLVLIALEPTDHIPDPIADMVLPDELRRSSYLLELFEHNGGQLAP